MSSSGSKSHTGTRRTTRSRLSKDAENALLAAATKKAELLTRARKLKEKMALEKKEFELQQQKAMLELHTEMAVEQAKLDVLEGYDDRQSLPDLQIEKQLEVKDTVQHWLDNAEGAVSATQSKPVADSFWPNSNPDDGKKGQATAIATTKTKVSLQEVPQEKHYGYELYSTSIGSESTYQTSESEIDSLSSRISPVKASKNSPSKYQYGADNTDQHYQTSIQGVTSKLPKDLVGQNPWISPTPKTPNLSFEKLLLKDNSESCKDMLHSKQSHDQNSEVKGHDSYVKEEDDEVEEDEDDGRQKRKYKQLLKKEQSTSKGCTGNTNVKKEKSDATKERSELSELASAMIQYQKKASLPHRDIPKFGGNPLEYHSFIQAFEYGVERKTDDEMDKLYFLNQCTYGEPNHLVKGFLNKDPNKAFKEAKAALGKKFGNKFVIVSAFKEKATKWPDVKREDSKAWSSLSIFLTEMVNTVTDLGCLQEVDHSGTIKVLLDKIPYTINHQWRVLVDSLEEREGKIAGFSEFVQFIEKQARIVSNPIYGSIRGSADKAVPRDQKKGPYKKASFATTTNMKEKWCKLCEKQNHSLAECRKLGKMPYAERTSYVKQNKLCFACLEEGHFKPACTNRDSTKCQKCKKKHPTSLHDPDRDKREKDQTRQGDSVTPTEQKKEVNVMSGHVGVQSAASNMPTDNPLMTIIPVLVKHEDGDRIVATYAFLDNGSSAVFVNEQLRSEMNWRTRKRKLIIETLNSSKSVNTHVVLDKLQVGSVDGTAFINLPDTVYVKDSIPVTLQNAPTQEDLRKWDHLSDVQLPVIPGEYPCISTVSLMIGSNTPAATMPLRIATGNIGEPYAVLTPLGWTVYGIPGKLTSRDVVAAHFCSVIKDGVGDLEQQFRSYVNMDFNETLSDDRKAPSKEDRQFLDIVSNTIKFEDGHYSMSLPIRDREIKLPVNRIQAQQRAEMLKRKFANNEEFYKEYRETMQQVINKGYAEPVPEDTSHNAGNMWYIPHHGVYHPTKKKLRVVYDCAAEYHGTSLNKHLLQGPDMTNSLLGVLLRFRQQPVALVADIEAMFHQVKVNEEDRDMLRFLWWSDGDVKKPLQDYRMTSHIFGATSSPACANYALKKTAADNKHDFDVEVIDTLENNFYVDDCLKATMSETKAASLAQDLISVCQKGGFHLTKWTSNSDVVMESILPCERSVESRNLDFQESSSQKTLGMLWLIEPDKFGFEISIKDKPSTRRGMLSTLCSLYDPLGLLSPVVLQGKQMLQELCRLKIGWDGDVPEEIRRKWSRWLASIPELQRFTVQRCWKPVGFENAQVQVHHFADASENGFGTASYLRLSNETDDVECNLIMSKARVAPLKQVSIPRMELSAATLAVKVDTMLKRELDVTGETIFWSDSQTVLKYIRNDTARFPVFVANRVSVIRDGSSPDQWRYVPSEENPADYASRGLTVDQFMSKQEWWKGPQFLYKQESEWPSMTANGESEELEVENTAATKVTVHASSIRNAEAAEEETAKQNDPVDYLIKYYSDWTRLTRAVAWWLRLKRILKQRVKGSKPSHEVKYLSSDEIQEAEEAILRFVQRQVFPLEISVLQKNQKDECDHVVNKSEKMTDNKDQHKKAGKIRKDSSILNLNPVLSNGLLKVGGRLHNANLPEETKHQLILPKKHHVVDLIINHIHRKCNHQGRNHTLAELRQKYWVIQAGVAVKSILRKCIVCRKQNARVNTQLMADLPTNRVSQGDPPFTYTGMDYFGPFMVKQARSMKKRYGVIFTCMITRAVHIEIASTMDTSSCINALRRFISRRGTVREITSDNGSNLVGANQELRRALEQLKQEDLQRFSASEGIKWRFNPPAASHHGGVWERQIRTIRKILQSMLDEQHLKVAKTEEQLHTLMCEVEATLNSRPLTKLSDDPTDFQVLTPNHLLLLRSPSCIPPGIFNEKDNFAKRRWRQVQYLSDLFWKRWVKEYLTALQQRQKWLQPKRNLQEGDIVLMVNDKAPRNSWAVGRVIQVLPGREGFVRQVQVQTKSTVLTRPVSKLCTLLEADAPEETPTVTSSVPAVESAETHQPNKAAKNDQCQTRVGRKIKKRQILDL